MKIITRIFKTIVAVFIISNLTSVYAQAPQKMSYQAVIRNASNALVTNQAVGMRVSILRTSAAGVEVYKEIFNPNPMTNANGLVTLEIGTGLPVTGTFATIDWANGPYFVKTETDPTGATNYTLTATSQLLSVPYALFAANAGSGIAGATTTSVFTVTSTAANISSNYVMIDNPSTNNNPNAIVLVTHDYESLGLGVYLNKAVGVFYNYSGPFANKWGVYLEDRTGMPVGVKFNVLVFNP